MAVPIAANVAQDVVGDDLDHNVGDEQQDGSLLAKVLSHRDSSELWIQQPLPWIRGDEGVSMR